MIPFAEKAEFSENCNSDDSIKQATPHNKFEGFPFFDANDKSNGYSSSNDDSISVGSKNESDLESSFEPPSMKIEQSKESLLTPNF